MIQDPIHQMNFTDSLKRSVMNSPGTSYLIARDVNEMNKRLALSIDEQINLPEYTPKITEMRVNENGVVDRIVFDGMVFE